MIESIRKEKKWILLLDCGEVFGQQIDHDNAELHLKAMERMGYDALNLAGSELAAGKEFLERNRSLISFPYIASNLVYEGSRIPWMREYLIRELGGIKVAILGILDPDGFKKLPPWDSLKGFEVRPPGEILDRLLPEVRGKADLVILVSHLDDAKNHAIVNPGKGVDLILSAGIPAPQFAAPHPQAGLVLHAGVKGMTLGLATVTVDPQKGISISERRPIPLDRSVPDHAEIRGLVEAYNKDQEIRKEKLKKELMEGLQLSPQEFMERYRKKQTERK